MYLYIYIYVYERVYTEPHVGGAPPAQVEISEIFGGGKWDGAVASGWGGGRAKGVEFAGLRAGWARGTIPPATDKNIQPPRRPLNRTPPPPVLLARTLPAAPTTIHVYYTH